MEITTKSIIEEMIEVGGVEARDVVARLSLHAHKLQCTVCGSKAEFLCEACHVFPYCSKKCQEFDWVNRHRAQHRGVTERASTAALAPRHNIGGKDGKPGDTAEDDKPGETAEAATRGVVSATSAVDVMFDKSEGSRFDSPDENPNQYDIPNATELPSDSDLMSNAEQIDKAVEVGDAAKGGMTWDLVFATFKVVQEFVKRIPWTAIGRNAHELLSKALSSFSDLVYPSTWLGGVRTAGSWIAGMLDRAASYAWMPLATLKWAWGCVRRAAEIARRIPSAIYERLRAVSESAFGVVISGVSEMSRTPAASSVASAVCAVVLTISAVPEMAALLMRQAVGKVAETVRPILAMLGPLAERIGPVYRLVLGHVSGVVRALTDATGLSVVLSKAAGVFSTALDYVEPVAGKVSTVLIYAGSIMAGIEAFIASNRFASCVSGLLSAAVGAVSSPIAFATDVIESVDRTAVMVKHGRDIANGTKPHGHREKVALCVKRLDEALEKAKAAKRENYDSISDLFGDVHVASRWIGDILCGRRGEGDQTADDKRCMAALTKLMFTNCVKVGMSAVFSLHTPISVFAAIDDGVGAAVDVLESTIQGTKIEARWVTAGMMLIAFISEVMLFIAFKLAYEASVELNAIAPKFLAAYNGLEIGAREKLRTMIFGSDEVIFTRDKMLAVIKASENSGSIIKTEAQALLGVYLKKYPIPTLTNLLDGRFITDQTKVERRDSEEYYLKLDWSQVLTGSSSWYWGGGAKLVHKKTDWEWYTGAGWIPCINCALVILDKVGRMIGGGESVDTLMVIEAVIEFIAFTFGTPFCFCLVNTVYAAFAPDSTSVATKDRGIFIQLFDSGTLFGRILFWAVAFVAVIAFGGIARGVWIRSGVLTDAPVGGQGNTQPPQSGTTGTVFRRRISYK